MASGGVELYSYAVSKSAPKDGSEGEVVSITQFKQDSFPGPGDEEEVISCRAVYFTPCGERIIAGYEDTNITMFDLTKGKIVHTYEEAHGSQVERLICIDDNVFASGDENGEICLWDIRTKAKVYSYKEHRDYISDFTIHVDSNSLCAVSGDGTLSVHDIARR